jgi:hypothetical protein
MEYSCSELVYSLGFDIHVIFWSFIIMLLRTKTFRTLHSTRTFAEPGNRRRWTITISFTWNETYNVQRGNLNNVI